MMDTRIRELGREKILATDGGIKPIQLYKNWRQKYPEDKSNKTIHQMLKYCLKKPRVHIGYSSS